MDPVFRTKYLETLLRHGYAVVVIERPGTGASFGVTNPSFSFQAGSRIRITVAFADADNFDTPILDPAPEIKVWRDANHASFIEIPMIPAR